MDRQASGSPCPPLWARDPGTAPTPPRAHGVCFRSVSPWPRTRPEGRRQASARSRRRHVGQEPGRAVLAPPPACFRTNPSGWPPLSALRGHRPRPSTRIAADHPCPRGGYRDPGIPAFRVTCWNYAPFLPYPSTIQGDVGQNRPCMRVAGDVPARDPVPLARRYRVAWPKRTRRPRRGNRPAGPVPDVGTVLGRRFAPRDSSGSQRPAC